MAILASDVILLARTLTDHQNDTQIQDNPGLLQVLSPLYLALRRKLAMLVPTLYTKRVQFTLSSGNTQDYTASPLSLTDFERAQRMRRQISSSDWTPVGIANPIEPEQLPQGQDYVYLERGTVLEFYPSAAIPGSTFELSYITKATKLSTTGDTLDIPDGADLVLAEQLAAKIRPRFDEDPSPHIRAAGEHLTELKWDLVNRYGVDPEAMPVERR